MTSKLTEAALTEKARGVYIIAATPFTDEGALDLASLDTLTDFELRGTAIPKSFPSCVDAI